MIIRHCRSRKQKEMIGIDKSNDRLSEQQGSTNQNLYQQE